MLQLSPSSLESSFWHSSHMSAASRKSDMWACGLLLVMDILYVRMHLSMPRTFVFWLRASHCALQLASTLVQLAFVAACWHSYSRWRGSALAVNRIFRMAVLISIPLIIRTTIAAVSTGIDPLPGAPLLPPLPPRATTTTLVALRDTIMFSGSLFAFITTLHPLPWKQQLATQALLLIPLLSLHHPIGRIGLTTMLPLALLCELCHWMNSGLDLLAAAYVGSATGASAPIRSAHCKAHAPDILLLFVQLYIGLFLPVYFTYRIEQQHKVAFLRAERQGLQLWDGDTYAPVAEADLLVLLLASGLLWVLATLLYGLLPMMAVPL